MNRRDEFTIKQAWLATNNSKQEDHSGKVVLVVLKVSLALKASMTNSGNQEVEEAWVTNNLSVTFSKNSRNSLEEVEWEVLHVDQGGHNSRQRVRTLWWLSRLISWKRSMEHRKPWHFRELMCVAHAKEQSQSQGPLPQLVEAVEVQDSKRLDKGLSRFSRCVETVMVVAKSLGIHAWHVKVKAQSLQAPRKP